MAAVSTVTLKQLLESLDYAKTAVEDGVQPPTPESITTLSDTIAAIKTKRRWPPQAFQEDTPPFQDACKEDPA